MTRQQMAPFCVHELLVAAKLSSVGNHGHVTQRMQYRYRSDRPHTIDTIGEISVRRPKIQPDRRRQRPCLGLAYMIAQRGGDSGLLSLDNVVGRVVTPAKHCFGERPAQLPPAIDVTCAAVVPCVERFRRSVISNVGSKSGWSPSLAHWLSRLVTSRGSDKTATRLRRRERGDGTWQLRRPVGTWGAAARFGVCHWLQRWSRAHSRQLRGVYSRGPGEARERLAHRLMIPSHLAAHTIRAGHTAAHAVHPFS